VISLCCSLVSWWYFFFFSTTTMQHNSDLKHTEFKNAQQLIILLIR
jgi:hypothetical protein